MFEPRALPELPQHLAVVRALSELDFQFDVATGHRSASRIRGFAPESVVEVIEGPPLVISLLFSVSGQPQSAVRSAVSVSTLASVLGVDFTTWLAQQLERRGVASPWRSTRRFGPTRVSAEYLSRDAVLLTIEATRE